jgi:hypothetical protein
MVIFILYYAYLNRMNTFILKLVFSRYNITLYALLLGLYYDIYYYVKISILLFIFI